MNQFSETWKRPHSFRLTSSAFPVCALQKSVIPRHSLDSRVQPARASKSSVPGVADLPQHSLSTPKLGAVHKSCPHFGYFSETLFIWEAYTADCSSKCGRSSSSRPVKKMSFSCHGMQRVLRLQVVQYLLRSHSLPLHLNGVEGYSHWSVPSSLGNSNNIKKQCLAVPYLWLPQVVLLHRSDLEYSGCFMPLTHVNQDMLPCVRSRKECARDCSCDCAATPRRAVKVKPFLMADFPLVWCQWCCRCECLFW